MLRMPRSIHLSKRSEEKEDCPMRRHLFVVFIALIALLLNRTDSGMADTSQPAALPVWEGAFVPNEILIGLKPEAVAQLARPDARSDTMGVASLGIASLDHLNRRYHVQAIVPLFDEISPADQLAQNYGLDGVYKVVAPIGVDVFAMIADDSADPAVAYAEPNRIYQVTGTQTIQTSEDNGDCTTPDRLTAAPMLTSMRRRRGISQQDRPQCLLR